MLTQSVRQVLTRRQVTCGVTIDLLVGYEAKKRTAYGEDMLLSAGSLRTQGRRPLLIAHDSEQGPNNWRHYGVALGVALGYYAGAKLGLLLTLPPQPTSILWVPNALLMAALLLAPPRWWWLYIVAAFPAHLAAELQADIPLEMVLCWFASNVSEALIGAGIMFWLLKRVPTLGNVQEAVAFIIVAGLLAPLLSSFIDAAFVRVNAWSSLEYWQLWMARFPANVLAVLTIIPVILTWASVDPDTFRKVGLKRLSEAVLLLCCLVGVSAMVFTATPSSEETFPALLFLPLPFHLWAALRFGQTGSSTAFATIAAVVLWGAAHGRGPLLMDTPAEGMLSVQLFLSFVAATLLVLAASIQERRMAEGQLRSSEKRFAAAFRFSPYAIAISRKKDGTLIDVNDRWLTMFGFDRDEVIRQSVREADLYVNEEERQKLMAADEKDGFVRDYEISLRQRDGTAIEALVTTNTIDFDGQPSEIRVIRNVTALRRATDALRRNEERFRVVLQATNDVIWDWDIASDKLWWNWNGDPYFGRSADDAPGDYSLFKEMMHPEERDSVVTRMRAMLDSEDAVFQAEYRLRRADGSYADVNLRAYIVRDKAGKPLRMIGSLTDITDRKDIEEAKRRLAHVSRLAVMGELTASIAHEINQPLGAILSNVDALEMLLHSGATSIEDVREIVADIRNDDLRAAEIIKHMRALSQRRKGVMRRFDLNHAINDIFRLVNADIARHGVSVDIELASLPLVQGDEVQLQQVLLNLILNGVEAMEAIPVTQRRLGIRTELTDTEIVAVRIWDSGPGIAPEHVESVFESFFTTKPNGLGLGLSIAKTIVEAHGGTIRAETPSEGGASFVVLLPARADNATVEHRHKEFSL